MKTILRVKWELLTTPIFITLFILSLTFVGIHNIREVLFTICIFLEIPLCYIGTKVVRTMIYKVWIGKCEYED